MKHVLSATARGAAAVLLASLVRAADLPPSLSDLRKPVIEAPVAKDDGKPVTPAPVAEARRVRDPARLCPPTPAGYLAVPDAVRLSRDWAAGSLGKLLSEPAMGRVLRNNRFGLNHLFADLPESVAPSSRLAAAAAVAEAALALAGGAERMAMAVYLGEDGNIGLLFIFDVGLNRVPAFEIMLELETSFSIAHSDWEAARGNHAGNYLDVWRPASRDGGRGAGEFVMGFAENMAIVANDAALAAASLALTGGGRSLAELPLGQRLAAAVPGSASAHLVGFVQMEAMLRGMGDSPVARQAVARWADYLGYGASEGSAIYYGLEFTAKGVRETYVLPTPVQSEDSLIEAMSRRIRPIAKWLSPSAVPYQPSPSFFFAANLENRQLGGLLRQDRRLFGLSDASAYAINIPGSAKLVFSPEMIDHLTGEAGIAFFAVDGDDANAYDWLLVIPCSGDPGDLLRQRQPTTMVESNRTRIYSSDQDWRRRICWAPAPASVFRRLPGDYLLLASTGNLLLTTLEQLASGNSFSANRDFSASLADAEKDQGQGLLIYVNTPDMLVRQYPNFSRIVRSLYPRSAGLNSRPPLSMLRRYLPGALGMIAPPSGGGERTRLTVQGPLPSLLAMAAGSTLSFPMSLRAGSRAAMRRSRENMQELWFRLQQFASRLGHFPESSEELRVHLESEMPPEAVEKLFTAPAALSRLSPGDAARLSYRYLAGVTPADEPDIPLIYEAQAWSEDFAGMYPGDGRLSPTETGEFIPFRQMILLDGTTLVVSEKKFQSAIQARLAEREE